MGWFARRAARKAAKQAQEARALARLDAWEDARRNHLAAFMHANPGQWVQIAPWKIRRGDIVLIDDCMFAYVRRVFFPMNGGPEGTVLSHLDDTFRFGCNPKEASKVLLFVPHNGAIYRHPDGEVFQR